LEVVVMQASTSSLLCWRAGDMRGDHLLSGFQMPHLQRVLPLEFFQINTLFRQSQRAKQPARRVKTSTAAKDRTPARVSTRMSGLGMPLEKKTSFFLDRKDLSRRVLQEMNQPLVKLRTIASAERPQQLSL
jgi:hypothetical protein